MFRALAYGKMSQSIVSRAFQPIEKYIQKSVDKYVDSRYIGFRSEMTT